ncbi:hypothetical protein [Phaeobacter sp. HF9A]|nr:hypothetical protein [Phaeobacter sp. HF9A]
MLILTLLAFGAGVLYERSGAHTRCTASGGDWTRTETGTGMICRM